jgi:hypothetical protein
MRMPHACLAVAAALLFSAPALADSALERAWAERDAAGGLERAIAAYDRASHRQDATPLVFERLVRLRYFRASERLPEGDERRQGFADAIADGLRGLGALAKTGGSALAVASDLDDRLDAFDRAAVGILYWTALAYGRTISDMSVFKRPAAAKRFKRLVERCLALDETYFQGGPHRVLAGYLAEAPGFMGGDAALAREHADAAIRIAPKYAENYVIRAEDVWRQAGDRKKYDADLDAALACPDEAAPDALAEQKIAKERARALRAASW